MEDRHYPREAYTAERSLAREGTGEKGRVWDVDADAKPVFSLKLPFCLGATLLNSQQLGGEVAFLGKAEAKYGINRLASWVAEGYRWRGFAANHMWFDTDFATDQWTYAWQPIAVLRKQWGDSFGPGEQVNRELRVYNDTNDTAPITATWSIEFDGAVAATGSETFTVAAGTYEPWDRNFSMPSTEERIEGIFRLSATQHGEQVFDHPIEISLLPEPKPQAASIDGPLLVWDTEGSVAQRLEASGYRIDGRVSSLEEVPESFGLLVVGKNALDRKAAANRRWNALIAAGNKMLFFEQEVPLHFQATPANHRPTEYDGTIAFSQNLEHPIFAGVEQTDLEFWGADEVVYRSAMQKPSVGAVSLVQVDDQLGYSAMMSIPVEDGLALVSQMAIAEKLDESVVARTLFDNLVQYVASYERKALPVTLAVEKDFTRESLLATGVVASSVEDPLAAIKADPGAIHVVEGTEENLATLAANKAALDDVYAAGGWLFVLNVTPESLDAFNAIVDYEHLIRPFRQELVRFPAVRDPLTSGLTQRDAAVMTSGKRIRTNRDEWPDTDAFSYILDTGDIAPFAELPSPAYWNDPKTEGPGNDTWPLNMVNGFKADAHWRLVFSIHLNKNDPTRWTMKLPREETVTQLRVLPNKIYHKISAYEITFGGDASTTQRIEVNPEDEVHVLKIANQSQRLRWKFTSSTGWRVGVRT